MGTDRDEKKLLKYIYLLCIVCFLNLTIIKQPVDGGAMVMAVVTCVMIGFSYFIIRRYFPEGDKHIFIFASVLSVIGIADDIQAEYGLFDQADNLVRYKRHVFHPDSRHTPGP